ncbi:unnamed protein product [Symbiodinium natans]|uniref:Uncharacterized protein n=1 Tax=Symbiodinium natans TaxID=878477 RepID=A0A812L7A7_9DINO|nr:unnamed protein product [Symbiodinium natans]
MSSSDDRRPLLRGAGEEIHGCLKRLLSLPSPCSSDTSQTFGANAAGLLLEMTRLLVLGALGPAISVTAAGTTEARPKPRKRLSTLLHVVVFWWQLAAFMRLKLRQPGAPRLFEVPGGQLGAWALAAVKAPVLVLLLVAACANWPMVLGAVAVNFVLILWARSIST